VGGVFRRASAPKRLKCELPGKGFAWLLLPSYWHRLASDSVVIVTTAIEGIGAALTSQTDTWCPSAPGEKAAVWFSRGNLMPQLLANRDKNKAEGVACCRRCAWRRCRLPAGFSSEPKALDISVACSPLLGLVGVAESNRPAGGSCFGSLALHRRRCH